MKTFDVVVIGAGHAGCEAAAAVARLGLSSLLLTLDAGGPARLSCNPAMGGPGKSQLLREIDALGGLTPRVTDRAAIQVRTLNAGRGPAARAARAQCDRSLYSEKMREALAALPGVTLAGDEAVELLVAGGRAAGVRLRGGGEVLAGAVVVACGTFLRGALRLGRESRPGGRAGEPSSERFAASLERAGLRAMRFKTGTPPRIDGRSVDRGRLEVEPGEFPPRRFSLLTPPGRALPAVVCHVVRTTAATHALVRARLAESALGGGLIAGTGPRYCPSLETKITRFPEKESHLLFLEPEGLATDEAYLSGFSNSFPPEVQEALVRTLPGFEAARLTAPGYAVEYDLYDPLDLSSTFESRVVRGLWLAGQVNGTSGYEEAAAQGLVAGANAAFRLLGRPAWSPPPRLSCLGALAASLVTLGVDEPWRMMPSRLEHRLLLREDNADLRLAAEGHALGLLPEPEWEVFRARAERLAAERTRLARTRVRRDAPGAGPLLLRHPDAAGRSLAELLKRTGVGYAEVAGVEGEPLPDPEDALTVETEIKYEGFLERERREVESRRPLEALTVPETLDLSSLVNLSAEARERFARRRPASVDEAARMRGVTAADVAALVVACRKARRPPTAGDREPGIGRGQGSEPRSA